MSQKTSSVPTEIYLRTSATRQTIICNIPEHFNDMLAETGQQLETYKADKKFLDHLGVTGKRFHALMRGESNFLLCEAAAYAAWVKVPMSKLYKFIPLTNKKKAA